ncbi:MAG: winged helix-turn-helix transcriptional regulator [Acidobacteria bacterium]|nr:winged helix-turn-helix transcriptional regulator [Acidobacteriota bacterium]
MQPDFYGQYCPLSKGAEALAERWVPLILYELLCGSRRFNELRRGIPRISPSLLSARLRHLEYYGLIVRQTIDRRVEYVLTPAGKATQMIIEAMALWGKDHARTDVTMDQLDANRLMWDIRRRVSSPVGSDRTTIQFDVTLPEDQKELQYWLVFDNSEVDLCLFDPGFEPDLQVKTRLDHLAAIWLGEIPFSRAVQSKMLMVQGPRELARQFETILGVSIVAELSKSPTR